MVLAVYCTQFEIYPPTRQVRGIKEEDHNSRVLDKIKAHHVICSLLNKTPKNKKICRIIGETFKTYELKEGDIIDILATKSSIYGYFGIEGRFTIDKYNNSGSTLVRSAIGPNNGEKIKENQLVEFNFKSNNRKLNKLSHRSSHKDNIIKVLEGPQIDLFSSETIRSFFEKSFRISNNTDRMGIRLEGNKILSINSPNIPSEGIIKGSVQVPGDGNPIVLMVEHPTIGGYPKIATVILNDIAKLAQLSAGKEIQFQKISLESAEQLYDENKKYLNQVFQSIKSI